MGNELLGIAGLRRVEVKPQKGIEYKITSYKDGVRAARSIFARRTLKGGITTPEEVVDAYICLLYTSPSPRDGLLSRMPSSA